MNGTAARHEAEKILAELPDRISDVIKPLARQSPDHPALVQGDVTWTYSELAAVVADTALILKLYDIRPGDRVMIVSENSLTLVALILAASELDAWSVVVNPRLSAREVDLIREHSGARRVFYTIEVSDAARQHAERHDADIAVLRGLGTLGVGPLNRDTVPEPVEVDWSRQVAGARLYLGDDRQSQGGHADPPQPAVQRAGGGRTARADGQGLLRSADIAHRRLVGHCDRLADGRRYRSIGAPL
jgi:long-subunit acyl-CoA synthetase (AMP-forming)